MVNFSLEGKVALVTGASYGIGFALATAFAQQGAKIVFNDIKQELVDKGLAAYKAEGIEAKGYVCDVTKEEQVNAMVAQIEKEVGVIDILVNNAGIIKRIPMTEMSAADFRQVIDIDLNGPFIVSKAVIPSMIKKGHGKIINICSMMSELGRETVSAYAAAKGGLKMLTRNIASEYGEYNIQCNGIGPGYIATPQTAPLRERQADGSRHPFDSFIVSKTPAARWGTPEDLMGPAVFLASDASDFVNGHILYVDGGILAYIGKQPQSSGLKGGGEQPAVPNGRTDETGRMKRRTDERGREPHYPADNSMPGPFRVPAFFSIPGAAAAARPAGEATRRPQISRRPRSAPGRSLRARPRAAAPAARPAGRPYSGRSSADRHPSS